MVAHGSVCHARVVPGVWPHVPLPAALPRCFRAVFLSLRVNPATNKRKSPACHRNSLWGDARRAGGHGAGGKAAPLWAGLDPQPRSGGVCPHHPPPHPHLPMIRCCRKSPCTGTGCLKPLCPDNAEESQRFRARGGPRPLGLGRLQWGERAGEGARAPPLWGPEPTLGTLGCWGLLAPSPSRQHGHGGHPDPVPEQEVGGARRGGLAGTPSPAELWLPSSRSSTPSPNGCHPPCPPGTASSGSPPPPVSVSCFSRGGGNARTGLTSADYIP